MNTTDITIPIILAIAEIFGLMAIGGFAKKLNYIDERDINRWSKMVLDWLYPAFIFSSITSGFQAERLGELWVLPVIGFGLSLFCLALGYGLRFGLRTDDVLKKRTFLYFCAVNNFSYLPIVIVQNIWGNGGMLANLFFLNIGSTVANWTIGVGAFGGSNKKAMVRNMASPNLIATIAAIVVSIFGWHHYFPAAINHIIEKAGPASIPILLVLSGASLFRRTSFSLSWQVSYVTIVRLLILPFCAILALKILPIASDIFNIAIIVALMPVAISGPIIARVYKGDSDFAANAALVTTIVSIFTVPLALWMVFKM
jgi:malate permease and related proteins